MIALNICNDSDINIFILSILHNMRSYWCGIVLSGYWNCSCFFGFRFDLLYIAYDLLFSLDNWRVIIFRNLNSLFFCDVLSDLLNNYLQVRRIDD